MNKKKAIPEAFYQNYPGYIIQACKYGSTAETEPVVYDDTTACDFAGGVEWNILDNDDDIYQLEQDIEKTTTNYEFNSYYEDHLESGSQKSYKGMTIFVSPDIAELNNVDKVKAFFGGTTWEAWDDGSTSGMMQYVCTAHDTVTPESGASQLFESFKGMRVNVYISDTLTKDNIRAYIKALYGGSSWEIIDGDETTTGVWQLVRTDL